ncbi:MAG: YfhL family 4Fe-4S dicluster ferredoxin [Epsilonproteobacteria bacterium]|nr:YfhL family 4Fe-4S dicluster ferredoxin [Campylobacterota bacterium]
MSLKIIDECIACDACVEACPTYAIEAADPIYIIDPQVCCECVGYHEAPSCVPVCPVDAIFLDEDYPETTVSLQKKYESSKS